MQMARGYQYSSDSKSVERADKILNDISSTIAALENFSFSPTPLHSHPHCHQQCHTPICHNELLEAEMEEIERKHAIREGNAMLDKLLEENSMLQNKHTALSHELEESRSHHESIEASNVRTQKAIEELREQHREDIEKIAKLEVQIRTLGLELKGKEQEMQFDYRRLYDFAQSIAKLVGKTCKKCDLKELDEIIIEVSRTVEKAANEETRLKYLALEVQKVENELGLSQEMLARFTAQEPQPHRAQTNQIDKEMINGLQEKVKKLTSLLQESHDELGRLKMELKDHAQLKVQLREQTSKINHLEVSIAQFQRVCERQRDQIIEMRNDLQDKDYSINETLERKEGRMARLLRQVETSKVRDDELLRLRLAVAQLLGIEKRLASSSDSICLHNEIIKRLKKLVTSSPPDRHFHPQCVSDFEHRRSKARTPSSSMSRRPPDTGSRFQPNSVSLVGLKNPQLVGHRISVAPTIPRKVVQQRARSTSPTRNIVSPSLY